MAIAKKLASARNQLAKSLNEIPIRWGKYINHDMEEQKVIFVGHEKAIYDSNGKKLSEKLAEMEGNLSDAFSEARSYAVGDYCIYLNRLYRFTEAKEPGPWDGAKVTPSILSRELQRVEGEVAGLNGKILNDREVGPLDTITIGNDGYYILHPGTIGITEQLLFVSIVNWDANSEAFSVGCTTTDIFIISKPGVKLNNLRLRIWFR